MRIRNLNLAIALVLTLFAFDAFGQVFASAGMDVLGPPSSFMKCRTKIRVSVLNRSSMPPDASGPMYVYRFESDYGTPVAFSYATGSTPQEVTDNIKRGHTHRITILGKYDNDQYWERVNNPNGVWFDVGEFRTLGAGGVDAVKTFEGCDTPTNAVDNFCYLNPKIFCPDQEKKEAEKEKLRNDPEIQEAYYGNGPAKNVSIPIGNTKNTNSTCPEAEEDKKKGLIPRACDNKLAPQIPGTKYTPEDRGNNYSQTIKSTFQGGADVGRAEQENGLRQKIVANLKSGLIELDLGGGRKYTPRLTVSSGAVEINWTDGLRSGSQTLSFDQLAQVDVTSSADLEYFPIYTSFPGWGVLVKINKGKCIFKDTQQQIDSYDCGFPYHVSPDRANLKELISLIRQLHDLKQSSATQR